MRSSKSTTYNHHYRYYYYNSKTADMAAIVCLCVWVCVRARVCV